MPQTNFTPILIYKSDTASAVPSAGNLTNSANGAELAVNTADKRLFTKDSGGSVVEIGTNPSSLTLPNGTANGIVFANGSKVLTTGSALTFDGTNLGVGGAAGNSTNYSTVTARGTSGGIYEFNAGGTLQSYILGNSSELRLQTQSTQAITFNPNGSEQMRLTSTGLGIGTSSPGAKLDVVGTVQSNGAFSVNGTATGSASKVWFGSDGASGGFINVPSSQAFSIFQNNATLVAQFNSSGNLGLGVTPSAWNGAFRALEIYGKGSGIYASSAAQTFVTANAYYDGVGQKYGTSNPATYYSQSYGVHAWHTAPSGTAGNAISFTQAMTLDASGNLGIGITSAGARLDVNGGGGLRVFDTSLTSSQVNIGVGLLTAGRPFVGTNTNTNALEVGTRAAADLIFVTNSTERARIDSSGNFGIGTSSPAAELEVKKTTNNTKLQVTSSYEAALWLVNGGGSEVSVINAGGSNVLSLRTSNTERARIDSSGNLLVNSTSSTPANDANSGFCAGSTSGFGSTWVKIPNNAVSGYGAFTIYRGSSVIGSISYNGTGVNYNNTSDYRLKTVIGAVTGAGQRIDALQPVEYEWKADGSRARGFLAHQFQEVYAGSVTGSKDAVDANGNPVYQSMQASTSEVIADLVAELQSLRKRVAELEAK